MSLQNGVVRIGTAAVGMPLVVAVTYVGGWLFVCVVLVGALAAQYEFYTLINRMEKRALVVPGLAIGLGVGLRVGSEIVLIASLVLALTVTIYVFLSSRFDDPWQSASVTLMGAFYPTFLLTLLVDLRGQASAMYGDRQAFWLTLVVLGLVWVSDTAAYYVGKALGRRPLAPSISPRKTWEGSIGGAVVAVVAAVVLWTLDLVTLGLKDLLVLGVLCGAVGQLGDLAESRLKRGAGVKDSGTTLPGHGGMLDRLDATIVAVPLAYVYLSYVANVI